MALQVAAPRILSHPPMFTHWLRWTSAEGLKPSACREGGQQTHSSSLSSPPGEQIRSRAGVEVVRCVGGTAGSSAAFALTELRVSKLTQCDEAGGRG